VQTRMNLVEPRRNLYAGALRAGSNVTSGICCFAPGLLVQGNCDTTKPPSVMRKNIIICSDGTGNSAIKDRGTNVFKLFEAIDLNGHRNDVTLEPQIALYDDGVGTETFLPIKILGGAFGWGLKRNVLKLYTGLVRIYDPGDRIYLFGFSRGAFTVRTLAGLIARCGVLKWENLHTTDAMRAEVATAYRTYRKSYRTSFWRVFHGKSAEDVAVSARQAMTFFRESHDVHDATIHFVGVWDTVDAVGGPFNTSDVINSLIHPFKFPDLKLSDKVECAVQALSLDDARAAFEPRLWEADARVDQVWFAGVHSNVGGGYPKQGMSLVTLDWMMQKAGEQGLRLLANDSRSYCEHGTVDDKLYNSRAGLGVFYRWKPRNMQALCEQQRAGCPPKVHLSVCERIAHGTDGYAPGTLAPKVRVVYTPSGNRERDKAMEAQAEAVNAALAHAFHQRGSDLQKARGTLLLGRLSYYLYVVSCVAALVIVSKFLLGSVHRIEPAFLTSVLVAFGLSVMLTSYVNHTRSLIFSRFWHDSRQELRKAFKAARKRLRADQVLSSSFSVLGNAQPVESEKHPRTAGAH